MNSPRPRRRRVLRALGVIGAGGLAGCSSLSGTLDGDSASDDLPDHFEWFGPDVVGAMWIRAATPPDEIPAGHGVPFLVTYPGRMDPDVLGEEYVSGVRDDWQLTPTSYVVPGTAIESRITPLSGGYQLFSGEFDVGAIEDALSGDAVRTEPLEGGTVSALPVTDDARQFSHFGVAVTDAHIVIVSAPDEAHALSLPRAFVETRRGERPRFHETSDLAARAAGHLPRAFRSRGTWRPLWDEETFGGEIDRQGPRVVAYRTAGEHIRQTNVRWQSESERAEREDEAVLAADVEETGDSEDVSVTYDGALRVIDARLTEYPP